ncbi:phosphoribosyltransferase-like protein [Pavlovales sp. CCMP2436]|nr:phosphoribosyltransferase-like protein [Pavlovales sp. CCMP2436]
MSEPAGSMNPPADRLLEKRDSARMNYVRAEGLDKFNEELASYVQPGWEDDYIDYSKLKQILKDAGGEKEDGLRSGVDKEQLDAEFFPELECQLDKVNEAFIHKCDYFEGLVHKYEPHGPQSTVALTGEGGSSAPPRITHDDYWTSFKDLGKMTTYVWINRQGFFKIMKKYDKVCGLLSTGRELGPDFERRLDHEVFTGPRLETLIELYKNKKPQTSSIGSTLEMKLIGGTANPELANELSARLGVPLMPVKIGCFNDGEVAIQLMENVRNSEVYIIQPTCSPVNDNLMQLLLLISACRRASASRVIAVVPYYGYARQDRKERSRVPISAADVARLMESMGVDRVCCVDLHCGQIQGFFGPRTPVDNLWASTIALQYFKSRVDADKVVVVSPDAGGVARAKLFKDGLEAVGMSPTLAVIIKQRVKAGEVGQTDLVGSVQGCDVIIVDDMIDTAGTLCAAANELKQFGAKRVFAFATHGLFNNPAAERIERSSLEEVVTSNSIPLRDEVAKATTKIRQLSVGKLLAEAIVSIHTGKSVSQLFDVKNITLQ